MLPSRRHLLLGSLAWPLAPLAQARPAMPVLLMRHEQTDPGVGDPPGFVLDQCSTQRNLSPQGRTQARSFGARLASLGWRPAAIRSSRWCRCLHTGDEIAAGLGGTMATEPWPALDSIFEDRSRAAQQSAALRERLALLRRANGFELWVTHQVNISDFTGRPTAMGQALWVTLAADGRVDARPFERAVS